ncbi:MAG: hypothetical protein MR959_01325 [Selenomonas bovis]|nr:hypothetical protein [Selenomonas bovis]
MARRQQGGMLPPGLFCWAHGLLALLARNGFMEKAPASDMRRSGMLAARRAARERVKEAGIRQ